MFTAQRRLLAIGVVLSILVAACGGAAAPVAPVPTAAAPAPGASAAVKTVAQLREDLVKAAKAEGELLWYSTEAIAINDLVTKAFTEKYGIKVTVLRLASGDMVPRYSAERAANQATADLLTVGTPEPFDNNPAWFIKLQQTDVPEFANYPKGRNGWSEGNMLTNVTPNVIAYNTTLVKDPPKTWQDVADPKWAGKLALTNLASGRTYLGWANEMKNKYGIEFLRKIAANKPVSQPSGGPGAQQVAAGAFSISFPNATSLITPLIGQKAPIEMVIPNDPPVGSELRANVASNAKHPNAAKLLLDFRATVEGQELVCKGAPGSTASPRPDVTGCLKLLPGYVSIDYTKLTPAVEAEIMTAIGLK